MTNNATVLTIADVKSAVPAANRTSVTHELVDQLNMIASDPDIGRHISDGFITFASVLKQGKFSLQEYLNAVMYVSFKMMGHTNKDAWAWTFPERLERLQAEGFTEKDIASRVSIYNNTQLVNLVRERVSVPAWVLHQDAFNTAIKTQVDIMNTSTNDLARTQAANSIMTHLKKPDAVKAQIEINVNESNEVKSLKNMLESLAEAQMQQITNGAKTIDVAASKLVHDYEDAEVVDVE